MTYQELDQWNSPNYTAAANVPSVFGEPRNVKYITIHHWGDPAWGQTFEGVVSYLCDGNRPNPTSAHFIVEAGRSACIVSPDDAAWHAGSAQGNAESIGIECNPNERDGDYQTIGEVIAYLRGIYGDVPLVPHNHWIQTDCPGTYDLARLDAIARGTTPAPTSQEADVPLTQADADLVVNTLLNRNLPRQGGPAGNLNLAAFLQWSDANFQGIQNLVNSVPKAVVSQKIALADGTTPTLASILAAILAKPSASLTLTDAQAQALADQLKASVPQATLDLLKSKI